MAPANCLKTLGISTLLALIATTATSNDEIVAPADLAQLESTQERLQAQMEQRLRVRIERLFDDDLDRVLTARTTALLRAGNRRGSRRFDVAPAAMQGTLESDSTSNTTCRMVGPTLECVLRETGDR